MMRFLNSASAEGASEENLAIYARTFCQIDLKMMWLVNSASAEGASEENLAIYARTFCQIDPKMMQIPRVPKARAKKIWRFMRGLSAK